MGLATFRCGHLVYMPRRAFIGLSGPLLYDYEVQADPTPADQVSSPNPILDSPFGLLLLYDELWFLTRSLCPQNMRDLRYVRFVDEDGNLPRLADIEVETSARSVHEDPAAAQRYARVRRLFEQYDAVLQTLHVDWGSGPDNHTHTLRIGDIDTYANSVALESILFDLEVVRRLDEDVELVANSFGQRWLDVSRPKLAESDLAHLLVVDRIPNIVFREGPYHPVIDEARENPHLQAFRTWVSATSASLDADDAKSIKVEVEAAIAETVRDVFLRYLDEHRLFLTQGKTLTGALADLIVPYAGTAGTMLHGVRERRAAQELRWQGFLVSLERLEGG
jgi:hypothetical protein